MKLRTFVLRGLPALCLVAALIAAPVDADARSKGKKPAKKEEKGGKPELQRVPNNPFESIANRISNIRFFTTNYGVFGHDVAGSDPGGFWPRSNPKAYIYGGGVWFGAQKSVDGQLKNLSVIGYNPNSGASWFTPGRIGENTEDANKYRLYFSTDYNPFTGEPNDPADDRANGVNWPIWDTSPGDTVKVNRYFGFYVDDTTQRNRTAFPKGPAMISQEDIFATYNDRDVNRFEGQDEAGHPLNIQVEQTIYSWGFGTRQDKPTTPTREITSPYQDMIFLKYVVINRSTDTLYDCYMAPAMDMDIGAAANDRTKIAIERAEDDTLNLAVQWSEATGEASTYGYIGFDFLESPSVDANGFVRKDKRVFTQDEQVGLTTFQNWRIEEDPTSSGERYEFMAAGDRDGDDAAGDKRFLMATGPFDMAPGDTARVVVGLVFAWSKSGSTPTGTWDDMEKLLNIDRFAQTVYDNNFLAPIPPDPARLSWRPLDGGVELSWDETSERSLDVVERGLDFAGYLVQRRRIAGPKFTPTDTLEGWNIGWKTIGRIDLPPLPTDAQRYLAARTGNLGVLGAWWRLPMLADTCLTGGVTGRDTIWRVDTIKRPNLPDSLFENRNFGQIVNRYCFAFDPNDDRSNSTLATIFDRAGRSDLTNRYRNGFGGVYSSLLDTNIRTVVRNAIVAIIDSITGGHRFVDVGDDNGDNRIESNPTNLVTNERLINNVDYYYRLLAFDAGDPLGGTSPKLNAGVLGINEIKATPEAPPPTRIGSDPVVIEGDGLGGISNFQFTVLDQERLGQLFGGDTLEFEFRPVDLYPLPASYYPQMAAYYMSEIIVRRRSNGQIINRFIVPYLVGGQLKFSDRQELLDTNLRTGMHAITETADELDSIWLSAKGIQVPYAGTFTADPTQNWFGTSAIYKATFGISFDFNFTQFGDSLRFGRFGDTTTRDNPFVRTGGSNTNLVPRTQYLGVTGNPYTAIPSVGQIKPEITFGPGGVQDVITFEKQGRTYTFNNVPYLTVDVKNVNSYQREVIDPVTGQKTTETVTYNSSMPLDPNASIYADTAKTGETLARLIDPGSFGLFAYGWLNRETMTDAQINSPIQRARFTATSPVRPIPTTVPGRYYVGTVSGVDDQGTSHTLTFTHRLIVNGAEILLDFAGMGSVEPQFLPKYLPASRPTQDFAAGDKVTVDFTGGTLGLPQPGAKVLVAIPDPKPSIISAETGRDYSDEMLEQIRVVPNPYLVSHIGQRANSESVIYFTRLPERCTIEIYTEAGEQLTVIEHESTPDGRRAVNAWELITKSGRKSASQLLIARIVTPNGAETIKKFSIIVGGFRIIGG